MEKSGGAPGEYWLSRSPLFEGRLREIAIAPGVSSFHAMRKAPPTTIALPAAFERVVLDTSQAKFVRAFCLAPVCAGVDSDAPSRSPRAIPELMKLHPSGLGGTLARTETTGAGKRR